MKDVKSRTGEVEKQTSEYAPHGPVRIRKLHEPEYVLRIAADGSRELRVTLDGKVIHECKHAPPVPG